MISSVISLLLDAGNTRLKWAMLDGEQRIADGSMDYAAPGAALQVWQHLPRPDQVVGCNVAGPMVKGQLARLWPEHDIDWIKAKLEQGGVRNHYLQPGQLGADRWAALIGARQLQPTLDSIVVMAGTALTVDALTCEGDFLGGCIAPGFTLMRKALAKGTADLGLPDGAISTFPQSTGAAIVNGAWAALAGAVEVQRLRLEAERGREAHVLLSGGDAETLVALLRPTLKTRLQQVDNLVLAGLSHLALTRDTQSR